jgi:hypothetical protein
MGSDNAVRQYHRICAAIDPDAACYADIGRHLPLERDAFRPEDQPAGFGYPIDGGENLVSQLVILAQIIPERRQHYAQPLLRKPKPGY